MSLASSYLDFDEFKALTTAPENLVDGAHIPASNVAARAAWKSFVERWLVIETSTINALLRKRYAAPFASPVPEVVKGWLVARVVPQLYKKRGADASDEQMAQILEEAKTALEEMKTAADAQDGLYDLPLRQDLTATGIEKGGPFVYSEASPYDWVDAQRDAVRGGR